MMLKDTQICYRCYWLISFKLSDYKSNGVNLYEQQRLDSIKKNQIHQGKSISNLFLKKQ